MGGGRLQRFGHRFPVLLAHLFGHLLGNLGGQERQCSAEEGHQNVVLTNVDRQVHGVLGGPVSLRRSTDATGGLCNCDFEVATGCQLVEVVTCNVGMQIESCCAICCRDTGLVFVGEQEDVTSSRVTKGRSDGSDRRRELRRTQLPYG